MLDAGRCAGLGRSLESGDSARENDDRMPFRVHWARAVEDFMTAQLASGMRPTSTYTRRQHLNHLAARIQCDPWSVTTDALAGFMASQSWAPETRRSRRTTFAAFYSWALATHRVSHDPVAGLAKMRPSDPSPRPVPDRVYLRSAHAGDAAGSPVD